MKYCLCWQHWLAKRRFNNGGRSIAIDNYQSQDWSRLIIIILSQSEALPPFLFLLPSLLLPPPPPPCCCLVRRFFNFVFGILCTLCALLFIVTSLLQPNLFFFALSIQSMNALYYIKGMMMMMMNEILLVLATLVGKTQI